MKPVLFFLAALSSGALACDSSRRVGGPGTGGSGAGIGGATAVPMGMGTGGGSGGFGGSGAGIGGATAVPMGMGTGGGSSGGSGAGTGGAAGSPDETGGASGGGSAGTTGPGGAGGTPGAGGAAGVDNKIILFDGSASTFSGWASIFRPGSTNPWRDNGDGTMTVVTGTGDIQSKMKFQDLFVHVEYMTPVLKASDSTAVGQNRGNSGVFLKGSYEMEVIDSYGEPTGIHSCGAVYGIMAPLVSACFPGGQWNTYEIEFKANVCNAQGQKTANARIVKATLNGTMVQQDVDVPGPTTGGSAESCGPAGLMLQDHSTFLPVTYRNIWVIPRN